MINRKSYKIGVVLSKITKHICLSEKYAWSSLDSVYYLGGGYWRAKPIYEDEIIVGFQLINPSLPYEKIQIVEEALNILI